MLPRNKEKTLEWQRRSQQRARDRPRERVPLKRVSKRQSKRNRGYSKARREHLEQHPFCQFQNCDKPANQVHHLRGREGDRLTDQNEFMSCCDEHHDWIESNRAAAVELGYRLSRHRTCEEP